MPYHLELGSDGHSFKGKAIVVNSMTGKHHSRSPIPIERAKAQKRVLEAAAAKEDDGPCWDGYEMIGMKMKGVRKVPNCVPESK